MGSKIKTMINNKYDLIIIGAGASGIMAASSALKESKTVLVIENQNAPLRKEKIDF